MDAKQPRPLRLGFLPGVHQLHEGLLLVGLELRAPPAHAPAGPGRGEPGLGALVQDARGRLHAGHLPAIFTDAYVGYTSAILETFGRRYPVPRLSAKGREPCSVLRWPQGLAYGQVKKHYQRGRVERIEVRALYGKARLKHVLSLLGYTHINPSVVERYNGTSRLRKQRKVRKTLAFSKAPRYHRWMS